MTSIVPGLTQLPRPPRKYDADYDAQLIRALENALLQLKNPGFLTGTTANWTAVPTSPVDLPEGDMYNDNGVLKIVVGTFKGPGVVSMTISGLAPSVSVV